MVDDLKDILTQTEFFQHEKNLESTILNATLKELAFIEEWLFPIDSQVSCDSGRIDILAVNMAEKEYVIIELKSSQSAIDYKAVGQVLSYISAKKAHRGIIIGKIVSSGKNAVEGSKYPIKLIDLNDQDIRHDFYFLYLRQIRRYNKYQRYHRYTASKEERNILNHILLCLHHCLPGQITGDTHGAIERLKKETDIVSFEQAMDFLVDFWAKYVLQ